MKKLKFFIQITNLNDLQLILLIECMRILRKLFHNLNKHVIVCMVQHVFEN